MDEKKQVVSLESLNARINGLEKKQAEQKKLIAEQSKRLIACAGRLTLLNRVMELRYDVKLTEQMEKRQRETDAIIQRLLFKTTVITEVCWFARNSETMTERQRLMTIAAAVFCFDAEDEFWKEQSFDVENTPKSKGETTVREWALKCVKHYNASRLALVTQDRIFI